MTQTIERRTDYTLQDVERALTELAVTGGRPNIAVKRLRDAGFHIPVQTLCYWRDESHTQRYEEIRAEVAPRIREVVADECESLAVAYAQAERETLGTFDANSLEQREKPGAIRNLATAKAINVDKAQLLRDRPTAIVQRSTAEELLRSLGDLDGTASEILDAEVV